MAGQGIFPILVSAEIDAAIDLDQSDSHIVARQEGVVVGLKANGGA